jgi:hypothetical protein
LCYVGEFAVFVEEHMFDSECDRYAYGMVKGDFEIG